MDLVLRDARVVDGTGGPSYRADVAVSGGRIAAVHRAEAGGPRPDARRALDAAGHAVAPGVNDIHAHT
ncbi:D-aminoacylase, partial [Streptomyces albidoflavus]